MNWNNIESDLHKLYQRYDLMDNYESDRRYLKSSYEKIESLWLDIYNQIDTVNIVMISESPLFGENETYIYNRNTQPTSFFRFNDMKYLPHYEDVPKPKSTYETKEVMIKQFIKSGFITLDIFPFPLNEKDTSINYRKMSKKLYSDILNFTKESYLKPKLDLLLKKTNPNSYFLYRYKRLYDKTDSHLERVLEEIGSNNYKVDTIHSKNIPIDREKLYNLFH